MTYTWESGVRFILGLHGFDSCWQDLYWLDVVLLDIAAARHINMSIYQG